VSEIVSENVCPTLIRNTLIVIHSTAVFAINFT
jgi:hypothetical protein